MIDLDDEILHVERRLAAERAQALRVFEEYKQRLREQATSPISLALFAAVGFLAGTLAQRRAKPAASSPALGVVSLIASTLPAAAHLFDELRRRRARDDHPNPGPREGGFQAVEESRGGAT